MARAISLGVFCRTAPSTSAIMRSRKVWPGFGGDPDPQPVAHDLGAAGHRGADVRARLLEDRSRLAGDGGLVDVGDAGDYLAVARDQLALATSTMSPLRSSAGRWSAPRWPPSQRAGRRLLLRRAQGGGLGLAAGLRHGFGEVGEQDGEPQPERDLDAESCLRGPSSSWLMTTQVVTTAPTSTTNITGLPRRCRGSSLTKACATAALTSAG